jgi:hypothetical protein
MHRLSSFRSVPTKQPNLNGPARGRISNSIPVPDAYRVKSVSDHAYHPIQLTTDAEESTSDGFGLTDSGVSSPSSGPLNSLLNGTSASEIVESGDYVPRLSPLRSSKSCLELEKRWRPLPLAPQVEPQTDDDDCPTEQQEADKEHTESGAEECKEAPENEGTPGLEHLWARTQSYFPQVLASYVAHLVQLTLLEMLS